MDLGLNLPPPTQNQLKLLKEKIQDIKAKIHKMSDTYAWKWYDMETIESKDQLMKHYMKIAFGIQIPF